MHGRSTPLRSAPISAVIPNRDGADLLRRTLPPLLRELPTPENEVVVIDDASTDGSVEMLREEFSTVRVVSCVKASVWGRLQPRRSRGKPPLVLPPTAIWR